MHTASPITLSCSLADITLSTPDRPSEAQAASSSPHHLGNGSSHAVTPGKKFVTLGVTKCRTPDEIYFVSPSAVKRCSTGTQRQELGRAHLPQGGTGAARSGSALCRSDRWAELGTRSLFPGSLSALSSFHIHGLLSL